MSIEERKRPEDDEAADAPGVPATPTVSGASVDTDVAREGTTHGVPALHPANVTFMAKRLEALKLFRSPGACLIVEYAPFEGRPSGGYEPDCLEHVLDAKQQAYIEDCSVCCRPIVVDVTTAFDAVASISVRTEND